MASTSGTLVEDLPSSSHTSTQSQDIQNFKMAEHLKLHASNCEMKTPPNTPWQPVSPWGFKSDTVSSDATLPSFEQVMSEQLAAELQLEDERNKVLEQETHLQNELANEELIDEGTVPMHDNDTSNDLMLAQMLQAKLDREYNQLLSHQEKHVNRDSKVRLSFSNFRTDQTFTSDDDYSDSHDDIEDEDRGGNDVASADPSASMLQIKSPKGYVMFGKEVVTKHDLEISGRKNTAKFEDSFPLEFKTGDARGMDLQLSNKIYNSLKKYAYSEQRRGQRLHETKEHYTAEHAVDEKTRLILHRLINRGIIASVNGVISIGKEAVVIHAHGGEAVVTDPSADEPDEEDADLQKLLIPEECVLKVYKTTLNEFKARDKYIKDDYRFKDRFKKLNPRKIIHMWAEKEMHNLNRMTEAGIACPSVVLLRKHVLVMSFIGTDQQPAPKLKSTILSSSQKKAAYVQVVRMMKTLYHECKLVHADLSEYNLLWHEDKVWMIDVSQSVEPSHPRALEFLLRDCSNISKFFTNIGVPDVLEPHQLFNEVSGLNIPLADDVTFRTAIGVLETSSEEHAQQGRKKASQILETNES